MAWLAVSGRELHLAHAVRPHLVALARETGESGHTAILDGDQALLIDYVPGEQVVTVRNRVGVHEPLHCTAVGKAILAFLPEGTQEPLLARLPLDRYTARTISSRDALERELTRVRRAGVAVDRAEYNELLMCVAAPLLGPDGQVLGSIGLSMVRALTERRPGRLRALCAAVRAAGARASADLAETRRTLSPPRTTDRRPPRGEPICPRHQEVRP